MSSSKYASLFTCMLGCVYAHDVNFIIRTVYARTARAPIVFNRLNSAYNTNASRTSTSDNFSSTPFVHKVSTLNQAVVSLSKKKEDTELELQTTEGGINNKRSH